MSRDNIHTLYFSDLAEAAQFARSTPRPEGARDLSEQPEGYDWDMGLDLADTIDHAEGTAFWDGVSSMMDTVDITDKLAAKADLPAVQRDLVGGSVNVGAYLTGHPRHMRRRTPQPAVDKPVLTIGVSLGIAWMVKAEHRLNFGAALMSAVDQLERNGYRCEIIAYWRASGTNANAFKYWVNIEYLLKRSDQTWNPSALAFAIAHPAFQRRMTWRIAETQPQYHDSLRAAYCSNTNTKKYHESCAGDFDVYFGNVGRNENNAISTPADAFQYVTGTVNDQLARARQVQEGAA